MVSYTIYLYNLNSIRLNFLEKCLIWYYLYLKMLYKNIVSMKVYSLANYPVLSYISLYPILYRIFCSLYRIFCFNLYCNTTRDPPFLCRSTSPPYLTTRLNSNMVNITSMQEDYGDYMKAIRTAGSHVTFTNTEKLNNILWKTYDFVIRSMDS